MKVEEIITKGNKRRYILLDSQDEPIEPVIYFLRFKDNNNSARSTLRTYCYHLKLYFEFLEQKRLDYRNVSLEDLAGFMNWLKNPIGVANVTTISPALSKRKENSINNIMSAVITFYDYLNRHEIFTNQLSDRLKRQIFGSYRGFKSFLHHINKSKAQTKKILRVKASKSRPKTLTRDAIISIIDACSNIRDKFLFQLLWETGMRIGEALALWLEDFEIDARKVHIRDRGDLPNQAEIKTVNSPRVLDVSADLMNMYMDYIAEIHTDDVDTNHVFIKLSGKRKYEPLEYPDIVSLFTRLKSKTKIKFNPHMFRHTHLNTLRKLGWAPEKLRLRAGHAHVQTTMQMYCEIDEDEMREEWEKTEEKKAFKKMEDKPEWVPF